MSQPPAAKQDTAIDLTDFIRDVTRGLTRSDQKELPSQYLYDTVGSALFEVITLLPEYGLTRADERLLDRWAGELPAYFETTPVVAELGSGTGTKTRRILSAFNGGAAFNGGEEVLYFPIDISLAALERCEMDLARVDGVRVEPLASSYLDGLGAVIAQIPQGKPLLLLFLGSTIGNFNRPVAAEFLTNLRRVLRRRDVLFLGTDLEKPVPQLLAAYDDPTGVTAAFNLNVLSRINHELDGSFVLNRFRHRARYNETERRVEMHLESLDDQTVRIGAAGLDVSFRRGETIWTESSHKFNCKEVVEMARRTGFNCLAQWLDEEWPFAENVLVAD